MIQDAKQTHALILAHGVNIAGRMAVPVVNPIGFTTGTGMDPPATIYFYSPDGRAERQVSHLAQFRGVVQVDGYAGFEQLRVTPRKPRGIAF